MNTSDKDMFSRFVIELKPKLQEAGKILSVDVTAPDGGSNWSNCYDRNIIGDVADYIVFMAYDQYGISATDPGTTAGYNWVENSLKKFIDREEINSEKIILGIPFYTRLWEESNGKTTSKIVNMKSIDEVLPDNVNKQWNDELKQVISSNMVIHRGDLLNGKTKIRKTFGGIKNNEEVQFNARICKKGKEEKQK